MVCIQADFDAIQQIGNQFGISADGDALVQCVEVVIIEGQAHWQTLNDESGQILAIAPPLLFRVTFDELLIDITTYQRDSLFLKILRLVGNFLTLLLDFGCSLLWRYDTPHLVERVHVERQGVQFALVVGHGGVREAIKLGKLCNIIPNLFIIGMEDMSTILMNIDPFNILSINISRNIRSLVNNKHLFTMCLSFMSKYSTIQARSHYQIIVLHLDSSILTYQ